MATQKNELTNDQKREWAQSLYTKDRLSLKEISEKTRVSQNTLTKWKEKFNWENQRKSLMVTKDEQLRRLYNQLDWLTDSIAKRAVKVADSKEADTISKLTAAINTLETETNMAEIFNVGKAFLDFVRAQDIDAAKNIAGYYDAFIQHSL